MRKLKSQKGFTLMEMLIVIAIIGIMIAIAIPVFSAQLDKAQTAVNDANLRSAKAMAVAEYLLDSETTAQSYYFTVDEDKNLNLVASAPGSGTYIQVDLAAGGAVTDAAFKP